MSDKVRVLVVDDEPQMLRTLRINLNARGFDVTTVAAVRMHLRPPPGPIRM